ncbi:MAG: Lipopolysaccharide core heptosyltransferase RfaQ [Chlamydiae bacterium]|nr:Lipopolysaccharide core heptosyltransferase RfaQ [Chlamydiota bacterium]
MIKLRHLGDVLLSSPVFSNLKQVLPSAEVDAYIWKEAAPMLEGHPAVANLLLQDRKAKGLPRWQRLAYEWNLLRKIRAGGYDLVLNLTEGDRGAIATWASGASIRVGVDPGSGGLWKKRSLYTHLVKPCKTPRHTVERDLDVLRKIGIFPSLKERELTFSIPASAEQSAGSILRSYGLEEGEFVLIHPVSRWLFKSLPARLMAAVIDRLGEQVVLTGGSSSGETRLLEEITCLSTSRVVNLGGKTSLKELGALMQMSRGLITVDSVPLHMASALKIPVVALFGPTSEINWGPWQNPRSIVVSQKRSCRPCLMDGCGGSKMSDCLWTLSPDGIVEAFSQASEGTAAASSCSSLFALNSLETNVTE